jgi:hypothetical protein
MSWSGVCVVWCAEVWQHVLEWRVCCVLCRSVAACLGVACVLCVVQKCGSMSWSGECVVCCVEVWQHVLEWRVLCAVQKCGSVSWSGVCVVCCAEVWQHVLEWRMCCVLCRMRHNFTEFFKYNLSQAQHKLPYDGRRPKTCRSDICVNFKPFQV